jgi:hypothetical protein
VDGVEGIDELVLAAVSSLDRAVAKGVLHRNNAARRKARLLKRYHATVRASAAVTPAPEPTAAAKARASRTRTPGRR